MSDERKSNFKESLEIWLEETPKATDEQIAAFRNGYYAGWSDKNHSEVMKGLQKLREDLGLEEECDIGGEFEATEP